MRAFWDTDGGCPRYPSSQRKLYIDFTQKNPEILRTIKDILNQYGIITGEIRKSEKKPSGDIHRFAITGKQGMLLFIRTISSWHPAKRPRLERMCQLIKANATVVK
ncbi:MAG: LAGLIDADG family homing endonuclease [Promethearchaeota archaeon]